MTQSFQFHPVAARWFAKKFGSPTEPQLQGWPAIQSGGHALIAAPTGSGKTLAAFFASLDALFREGLSGALPDETRVLYVSPLKALSNDIHKNLEEPLAELRAAFLAEEGRDIEVRAAVRTGDTSAASRLAIARKPPHILVTTPESFYLLLTSESGRRTLSTVRTLIVDEIHAVVANRRGAHLALSMERLAALTGRAPQRIGLSATQNPIEEVARFLVGTRDVEQQIQGVGKARCAIINSGHRREMDLAIELPGSPLEAVMSNEVWVEVYSRLTELIEAHRTTLVFVNTRRMAERVSHLLAERLGENRVTSHHGSLAARLRLDAEQRLKRGELKALVATASLELGIDIGSVDLVCQLGSARSLSTILQRVGRAGHKRGGLPKGRIFPLSRDELAECVAALRSLRKGEMDCLQIPAKPLDVLAQQMVACVACEDWTEDGLLQLMRGAWPYRDLATDEFQGVLRMLAEGFSTKRGRRGALIHHDAVNHRVRGRRGSRLLALTSGGAIPDNADYRVVLEPGETFIGTVNEDFAVESTAGDVFQLGNASWRMLRIQAGTIRVEDAQGQPPGIPFWLGEAPGRTAELSRAVSDLREKIEEQIERGGGEAKQKIIDWLAAETGLAENGARQLAEYFAESWRALGAIPSQNKLVMERFFDESGGMQLVIHAPFGIRANRAWGLALRKRFCRSFNFELQAAASDDAIVLSLGTQHSFALEEVFRYLNSKTVRELLIQALLDAPMFPIRWRWNATRALALPRFRGGRKVAAPLLRMESENLLAAVFPDQLACLENIVGDRQIPDHPLVRQTIDDCLNEIMDVECLIDIIRRIERGDIQCLARDLPEPSFLAHEILNAKPYTFLDGAPLEERRTQAVYTRRAGQTGDAELGILDSAAIDKVCDEAWPRAENADELHDALVLMGVMTGDQVRRVADAAPQWMAQLAEQRRAGCLTNGLWVSAERWPLAQKVYPSCAVTPALTAPDGSRTWEEDEAGRELVRGQMEVAGPVCAETLAAMLQLSQAQADAALLALEAEGFVLRGKFHPDASALEWCDRRLLARIHRLTINQLRAEIQPVSIADFQRFLLAWQRVAPGSQVEGLDGLGAVLELLDGFGLPAAAWEPEVLALRVKDYDPSWLDQLCFTGRFGWGRLIPPALRKERPFAPVRSSPIALFSRENQARWFALAGDSAPPSFGVDTARVLEALGRGGALFFTELARKTGLLSSRVEQALGELAGLGWATADSFEGLRALLTPRDKRAPFGDVNRKRHHRAVISVEDAGRWSLLRSWSEPAKSEPALERADALEAFARALLRRYGVVFRRLLERETLSAPWYELIGAYRRLEARGEIRGGHFVNGVSGEQFALPEAVGSLRAIRKSAASNELIVISGADPLNLAGILTPGPRVAAVAGNRLLFQDGIVIGALEAGHVALNAGESTPAIERLLRVGQLPPSLRPYYS